MTLFELISILFKKLGDKASIMRGIKNLWNIPQLLKVVLIISLIFGSIYFAYSLSYSYQITEIKVELDSIHEKISNNLKKESYHDDMYYMFEAMLSLQQLIKYIYVEEKQQLTIIKHSFEHNHPNDPIVDDIDNIIRRNRQNFNYYDTEFKRSLYKCNQDLYHMLHDSIPGPD